MPPLRDSQGRFVKGGGAVSPRGGVGVGLQFAWNQPVTETIVSEIRDSIEAECIQIVAVAKRNTDKFSDTGNLKARIYYGVTGRPEAIDGKIFTDSGYAAYVEIGTGIHGPKGQPIRPKTAKVLSWRDPKTGARMFARQVLGRPKTPFLKPAIDSQRGGIQKRFEAMFARLARIYD